MSELPEFAESVLEQKLEKLSHSRQSIRGLSDWIIHHRKHHNKTVRIWYKEFLKAQDGRKLYFLYLANDVIQNGRCKGARFGKAFEPVMKKTFEHMARLPDKATKNSVLRILKIWEDRRIYEITLLRDYESSYRKTLSDLHGFDFQLLEEDQLKRMKPECSSKETGSSSKSTENHFRKHKHPGSHDESSEVPTKHAKPEEEEEQELEQDQNEETTNTKDTSKIMEFEVNGMLHLEAQLPPRISEEPPLEDDFIKLIQDLEDMPSTDGMTRGEIANLPLEVSDVDGVDAICIDSDVSRELQRKVNSAADLLTDYSGKLDEELVVRKKATTALQDFIHSQKGLHTKSKHRVKTHQQHYKILSRRLAQLKTHIRSMPDLATLPSIDDGLAPLPGVRDLFNSKFK